ncbi:MAG: translation initiation factor IF-2 subunit beta [Promethearchaeota archaeon]
MDEQEYISLLDKAYSKLPEDVINKSRFEFPEAKIFIEGNKTYIKNFKFIIDKIKRESKHFLKFLLNEIGTAGIIDEQTGRVVLNGVFSRKLINETIAAYVKEFVLCDTCLKPDTVIEKQGRQSILVCHACGAWRSVRKI